MKTLIATIDPDNPYQRLAWLVKALLSRPAQITQALINKLEGGSDDQGDAMQIA